MSDGPKKRRQYSPEKMKMAISAVRDGMSKKQASKIFGVPRTTLLDKLAGRVPEDPVSPGTKPTLTQQEEKTVVNYVLLMADIGYPLTRKELLLEIKKILDLDGRKTKFKDNLPGKDWYRGFCQRNPEIASRTPQSLGHERAIISKEMIDSWYSTLMQFLNREVPDWESMIKDPRRMFNADESGFPLCVKSGKVLAAKGSKHVYQVVANSKIQITVMACFNAIGDYLPPMIVYPGQRFRDVGLSEFPEAVYGQTENGWTDSSLFVAFLEQFLLFVNQKCIPLPVLLFVDGHSTHVTLSAAEFCSENGIILYCLLPNATHILQACDIGLFSPMKSTWTAEVKHWQMQHIGEVLTKKAFPGVFRKVWQQVTTIDNALQGFKKSGLYPLTADGIDKTKLGPSKVIRRDEAKVPSEDVDRIENDRMQEQSSSQKDARIEENTTNYNEVGNVENIITVQAEIHHVQSEVQHDNEDIENTRTEDTECVLEKSGVNSTVAETTVKVNMPLIDSTIRRCNEMVSPAFESVLQIPEIPCKKTNSNIRSKLPKALTGAAALKMLRERERLKREEEEQKQRRKEERLRKKKEKEEEKERKKQERERKQKERELMKQNKTKQNNKRKRQHSDTESEEENISIPYMDSSDSEVDNRDSDDNEVCAECKCDEDKGESKFNQWIRCDHCRRWYHQACTNAPDVMSLTPDELQLHDFICNSCKL